MTIRITRDFVVEAACFLVFVFALGVAYGFVVSFDMTVDDFRSKLHSLDETARMP